MTACGKRHHDAACSNRHDREQTMMRLLMLLLRMRMMMAMLVMLMLN